MGRSPQTLLQCIGAVPITEMQIHWSKMVVKFVKEKRMKREVRPERGWLRPDPQESFWKLQHTSAVQMFLPERTCGHVNSSLATLPFLDHVSKVLPIKNCHVSKVSPLSGILQV